MTAIALLGAGGKMGYRLAKNLMGSRFEVRHVEVSDAGKSRLEAELESLGDDRQSHSSAKERSHRYPAIRGRQCRP